MGVTIGGDAAKSGKNTHLVVIIPPPFLPYVMPDDCEDENDDDDGDIYDNDDVTDHDCCVEDGSIAGTGAQLRENIRRRQMRRP